MNALLLGATGLVGREILRLLVASPACARVVVLSRRPLAPESLTPKVDVRVVDFDRLEAAAPLPPLDTVFCALGTTMRLAGSRERFRQVDYGYPLAVARLALERGARHFALVSALGANPRSRVFYNRVKGELEEAVAALGYGGVTIVRPSLLIGEREEYRRGERVMARLGFLVPRRYKPVRADAVARVLVEAAVADRGGVVVVESGEIRGATRSIGG
jgi:uncharacterized protein YbjT (DUF2867 family)